VGELRVVLGTVLRTLLGVVSDDTEGGAEGIEPSLPTNQVCVVCGLGIFPDTLPIPLDQGPAGSENGSIYPKPYAFRNVPLIDPERDILPMGGLMVVAACDAGSGGSDTCCNGGVENTSIIPGFTADDAVATGRIEPVNEPADKE
jgi:hypothetical protein